MNREKFGLLKTFFAENQQDIEQLHHLGITDYAILTYISRVREGQSRERALDGVLQGRSSLTEEQKQSVGLLLGHLSPPALSGS